MPDTTAAEREAADPTSDRAEITWRNRDLTLPAVFDDCDIDVLEAIENRQAVAFIRGILGDDQFAKIRKGLTIRDLTELGDHIAGFYGFKDLGE